MNALKMVGVALFVAAVTAASAVWYIDYKISEMTEAVMAPIRQTTEKVDETIEELEGAVLTATEAVESGVGETRARVAGAVGQTKSHVLHELENAQELAGHVGDWLSTVSS